MFHGTGFGKVDVDTRYSSPGMLKALLYNFDFDDIRSQGLKLEHASFLAEKVVPLLANDRGRIWMRGSASRVGAKGYNLSLSHVRVERVAAFLAKHGVSPDQMQLEAVGAELTTGHAADDERDRAVAFIVLPKAKIDPPPPPHVPPKPAVSQSFKLALLMGLSGAKAARFAKYLKGKIGAGAAADLLFFQIWDTTNNLASIYAYLGGGIGVGITMLPSLSGTTHGEWNSFTTSAPISSAQFAGPGPFGNPLINARFTTAGIGPKSFNWLHLLGTPDGVDAVYMMIKTGTTIGAGISSTVGELILLDGPGPFHDQ